MYSKQLNDIVWIGLLCRGVEILTTLWSKPSESHIPTVISNRGIIYDRISELFFLHLLNFWHFPAAEQWLSTLSDMTAEKVLLALTQNQTAPAYGCPLVLFYIAWWSVLTSHVSASTAFLYKVRFWLCCYFCCQIKSGKTMPPHSCKDVKDFDTDHAAQMGLVCNWDKLSPRLVVLIFLNTFHLDLSVIPALVIYCWEAMRWTAHKHPLSYITCVL